MARYNPLDPLGIYDAWKVHNNPQERIYDYDEDLDDEEDVDDDESTEAEEEFIPYLPTNASRTASDTHQNGLQVPVQQYKPPLNPAILYVRPWNPPTQSMIPSTPRNTQIATEPHALYAEHLVRPMSADQYIYPPAPSPTYSLLSFPPSGPSEASLSPLSSPRSSDGGRTASPLSSSHSSPHSPNRIRVFTHAPPSLTPSSQSGSYGHPIDASMSAVRLPSRAGSDHTSLPRTPPRVHIGSRSLPATPERPHSVSSYATSHSSYPETVRSLTPSAAVIAPSVPQSPTQALRRRVRKWMSVFTSRSPGRNQPSDPPENISPVIHRPTARHWDAMSTTTFSTNMTSVSRRLDIDEVSQVVMLPNELDDALSLNELAGPSISGQSLQSSSISISGLVGPSISSVYESTIAPVGPLPETRIGTPTQSSVISYRETPIQVARRRAPLPDFATHV